MREHRGKILRLQPNRVWRTYPGGRILDCMEGRTQPADGSFPEDWLGSTVRAINPGHEDKNEGLSLVNVDGKPLFLVDLIAADPEYFLGARHLSAFGMNPMVLVKYLDSAVRLPIQVHPTIPFSERYLNASCGKTEAYYILSTRPEVAEPFIYLGFQRAPVRQQLRRMILEQDIVAMEHCFDKIPVKPGDVYLVPGGLPHAIGAGVLMVEVMEPTDFVARVEFNVNGRMIPEPSRFMGRDLDFALEMFSLESFPVKAVEERWRCKAQILEEDSILRRESLVDERLTDRFRVARTIIHGQRQLRIRGYTILLVVEGCCTVATDSEKVHLSTYDRVVIPHGLGVLDIESVAGATLLECNPPES